MKVFWSPRHRAHDPTGIRFPLGGSACAEVPSRVDVIRSGCIDSGITIFEEPEDHGSDPIAVVHDFNYLHFLREVYRSQPSETAKNHLFCDTFAIPHLRYLPAPILQQRGAFMADGFTPILAGTWESAYWSAQCALSACDAVLDRKNRFSFALCRPPGHHAGRAHCGGFCYVNNAAIAARYLQSRSETASARAAVLDIDFHHGQGTQDIFYRDSSVLFASIHGHPDFAYPMFSGMPDEIGEAEGHGFTSNIPLAKGSNDECYRTELGKLLVTISKFNPEYLVVSLGFDILSGDPYGGFDVTLAGLNAIGRDIAQMGLPTVLVQEGGYQLEELQGAARSFFSGLLENS